MLDLKYPVIQAPMAGGIVAPDMVSAVSNFGMLGSIPSGYLPIQDTIKFIETVKQKTLNPFLLNIFVNYNNKESHFIKKPHEIIDIEKKVGLYKNHEFYVPKQIFVSDLVKASVQYNVIAVSTTFGLLNQKDTKLLKNNCVDIIVTVNTIEEATYVMATQNPTAIIFQTKHAGGHKGGAFNDEKYSDEVSIRNFINQHKNVYFIKTGGIVNKKDVQTALEEGFKAVQIGTGFLMTKESKASILHKQMILRTNDPSQIASTKNITGKLARGIVNKLFDLKNENRLGYPALHYATSAIRSYAKNHDLKDYQTFWAGDSALRIDSLMSLRDYMESLV
ncbi:MAG: nitronate monooxygenase [Hyphomicrobiales bacterium]